VCSKAVGFDHEREAIDIAVNLPAWQAAGDERPWKFIISPVGDRLDLTRVTRELMTKVQRDLVDRALAGCGKTK